jgi:excisionase family DNA binding protein
MLYLNPEYVSVSEAARILGADPRTVRRLITRGKLRALSFGRVYRVELASIGAMRVEAGDERAHVFA